MINKKSLISLFTLSILTACSTTPVNNVNMENREQPVNQLQAFKEEIRPQVTGNANINNNTITFNLKFPNREGFNLKGVSSYYAKMQLKSSVGDIYYANGASSASNYTIEVVNNNLNITFNNVKFDPLIIANLEVYDKDGNNYELNKSYRPLSVAFSLNQTLKTVTINENTTPTARVISKIMSTNIAMAKSLNIATLQTFVDSVKTYVGNNNTSNYGETVYYINTNAIAADIITATGTIPENIPANTDKPIYIKSITSDKTKYQTGDKVKVTLNGVESSEITEVKYGGTVVAPANIDKAIANEISFDAPNDNTNATVQIETNEIRLTSSVLNKPIYVNINSTATTPDGSSWANAYKNLNDAINVSQGANGGNLSLWVAAGTYKPDGARGSFSINSKNVKIYGGFNGTEADFNQRNVSINKVILSGDLNNNGFDNNDSYHVISFSAAGLVNPTVIDGLTITGGNADNSNTGTNGSVGGGLFNSTTYVIVNNVIFSGNKVTDSGAAVYDVNNAKTVITNSIFINNNAGLRGGAIYNWNSSLDISKSIFSANTAGTGKGGAIYNDTNDINKVSSLKIDKSTFANNTATDGANIYNLNSTANITNSIVYGGSIFNATPTNVFNTNLDIKDSDLYINNATKGIDVVNNNASATFTSSGILDVDPNFDSDFRPQNTTVQNIGAFAN